MCLSSLEKFSPARVGYQVKHKRGKKKYSALFFSHESHNEGNKEFLTPRGTLEASTKRRTIVFSMKSVEYPAGFHCFHLLKDAKSYKELHKKVSQADSLCIVQVKCLGHKTTGRGAGSFEDQKITVCQKIEFIKEI